MKFEQSNALQLDLIETLPHKPYCTDELGVTYIRPKSTAIKKKYLQVNQPKLVTYLVFDIDRQGGVLAWYDNDLPTPYWTSKNPENAHAHIAYRLKVPFCTSDIAHSEPIRYAAAIESAMIERLKADRGFAGLLAEYLDLKGHPLRGSEVSGLGRNCELFDTVRQWSYKAIREFWAPNYKRKWNSAVYDQVEALNAQFKVSLPVSEVKAIANSPV